MSETVFNILLILLRAQNFTRLDLGCGPAMHKGSMTVGLHPGFEQGQLVIEADEGSGHFELVFSPEDWVQALDLAAALNAYAAWCQEVQMREEISETETARKPETEK